MRSILKNQTGSALIASVFIVVAMGIAGMGMMQLSASETSASADHLETTEAFYGGQGAIERVKYMLDWGQNPAGNIQVGSAISSISTVPLERLASVVTQNGRAKVTQTINTDFSRDAIQFNTAAAVIVGNEVRDTVAIKTKLRSVTLATMKIKWNKHTCVLTDTYAPNHDLSWCAENSSGYVQSVTMQNTQIYGSNIGSPNQAASNQTINVVDYSFVANQNYSFNIALDQAVPSGTLFTVTFGFLDGSELDVTYQVHGHCDLKYFARNNGVVEIDPQHKLDLKVIGSSITYGANGPEVSVRTWLGRVASNNSTTYTALFNSNDVDGGETYSTTSSVAKAYKVKANAWYSNTINVTYDSSNTKQVKTLVNGDTPPKLAGFGGQASVKTFLQPYLGADKKIKLNSNQVIMLFELGVNMTTDPNSVAADFQDLVVLLTVESISAGCTP